MSYPNGSEWRKWDLHVHTPASHTARYGTTEDAWERFLVELAALPSELSVIGISDYIWVDGYARVLAAHTKGRLPNIEALFPVIELRIADFIGTEGRLSRLNAHVIFGPGCPPDLIQHQFIPRLVANFRLTDQYTTLSKRWNAIPTRDAITDLGRLIKSTIPPGELTKYGSDFIEGFSNWVIPLEAVAQAAQDSSFPEPPLLALGKTEWEDIPWGDNTIASKKNLISTVDLLFTAASSPGACNTSVGRLRASKVNHRLLDCSDAHEFSDSREKDRLGNCFTWICADPTLAGLKHALIEYRSRVFIGDKPPLLLRQETDPTQFISSVSIRSIPGGSKPPPMFDVSIPINKGFVAIVGNKGSGKSALLDSIALAANSRAESEFTFLSDQRFRSPRNNKAHQYQVELTMADDDVVGPVRLSSPVDHDRPERVRYLPQSLLEKLCNKQPGVPDDPFEVELRSIIFSHVPIHQRLECESLDELLRRRGESLKHEIEYRRSELANINRQIAELEELARPSRQKRLRASLDAIEAQLTKHDEARPPDPVPPPPNTDADVRQAVEQLEVLRADLARLDQEEARVSGAYTTERQRLDASDNLARELEIFNSEFSKFKERTTRYADVVGLALDDLVRLELDLDPLTNLRNEISATVESLDHRLGPEGEIATQRSTIDAAQADLEARLDEPRRRFEQQLRELEAWSSARDSLVGTATEEDTRTYFAEQLADFQTFPERLANLRTLRLSVCREIHASLLGMVKLFRELYQPVQSFLTTNELARSQFSLEFEVDLEFRHFTERFLAHVDRSVSGTFYGVEASEDRVTGRVRTTNPLDWESLAQFINDHELDLRYDRRTRQTGTMHDAASDTLRKGVDLASVYNYLFGLSYLDAQYGLRSGGRLVSELSPGQKGTILLMFYLLVDQSGRPIALDQPDENLDNHTIHTLLRPAIRTAKATRQILVVTHSPNLAVVGDADQVVVASCDGKKFAYQAGSIENPEIRDLVVKVLEGTWPAYSDRGKKYMTSASDDRSQEPID